MPAVRIIGLLAQGEYAVEQMAEMLTCALDVPTT